MNWDAIGAVAESLAALGVIVSLIYVGLQVRQNSRSVRAATAHSMTMGMSSFVDSFLGNGDLANAWIAGSKDFDSVSEELRGEVIAASMKLLRLAEDIFLQHKNGMLDDAHWEGWRNWILSAARVDCVRLVYTARKSEYHSDFRTFLETEEPSERVQSVTEIFDNSSSM